VNYLIHELASKKGSEYISLEIWTNGSIHPTQALQFALKKLTKLFFNFSEVSKNFVLTKKSN
jgi:DNA-directed RNA polymerase alpha subunit